MSRSSWRWSWLRDLWATLTGGPPGHASSSDPAPLALAPDEPSIAYFEQHADPITLETTGLPGSIVAWLSAAGLRLVVSLVNQGRLVGLLGLGESASRGTYSADDLAFLSTLADEAAAAVTIAHLLHSRIQSPGGNVKGWDGVSCQP